jgi:hypothetical protein
MLDFYYTYKKWLKHLSFFSFFCKKKYIHLRQQN